MGKVTVDVRYETFPPGRILPSFVEGGFSFDAKPGLLIATGDGGGRTAQQIRDELADLLKLKSCDLVYEVGRVVRFQVGTVALESGAALMTLDMEDTIDMNADHSIGLAAVQAAPDRLAARDRIIRKFLAHDNPDHYRRLRADATLVNAVEHLVTAVVHPVHQMAELYSVIEVIENRLGGRREFSKIGLSKSYVDYITSRANRPEHDERHPPVVPVPAVPIAQPERDECHERTCRALEKYAQGILANDV